MSKVNSHKRAMPTDRIVISVPSGDMMHTDSAFAVARTYGHALASGLNCALHNLKSSEISYGRNCQVHQALTQEATHILFVDSDMVFPPESLHRLLSHRVPIVGCTYSQRREPRGFTHVSTQDNWDVGPLIPKSNLFEVKSMGMGLCLVETSVFKALPRPWFKTEYTGALLPDGSDHHLSEDVYFFTKAREAGWSVWCDWELSQSVTHLGTFAFELSHIQGHWNYR